MLTSITLGLYSISGVLAAYIIRKPGAAFFTLGIWMTVPMVMQLELDWRTSRLKSFIKK
ncbi:hypothetical protein DMO16_19535 [Fictibacillus sp. S7]|nr:ECF transporter S component [Fictibacillus sp. S7]RXZ02759.1 hypothetical protein DMO16_19535 [Fictibacillus sp. S7]